MQKIQAIKDKVLLSPSLSTMRNGFWIPEHIAENTSMCKVVSIGENAPPFIKVGDVVMCQVNFSDRNNLKIGRDFFCERFRIFAVFKDGRPYPIGRRVLIERDIAATHSEGGIEIPELRRYQSLDGRVIRLGLSRERFRNNGIQPGDKIRLASWTADMVELELPNGEGYGLIVNENDLLFKYED